MLGKSVGVKMMESFVVNIVSCFHSPKTGEEESKLLHEHNPKSTAYKTINGQLKFFTNGR